MLVNRAPQVLGCAVNFDEDFVQMPCIAKSYTPATQLGGIGLPKVQASLPDRLIDNRYPTLG